jgi:hypothetical protein
MPRVTAKIVLAQVGLTPPGGYVSGSLDNMLMGAAITASNVDDSGVVAREWILSPNVNTVVSSWSTTSKNGVTFTCTPPGTVGYGDAVLTLIVYGKQNEDGSPNISTDTVVMGIRATFSAYSLGIPIPHPLESSGGGPVTIDARLGREARVAELGMAIAAVAGATSGVPSVNGLSGPATFLDSVSIVWTPGTAGGGRTLTPKLQFATEPHGSFVVKGAANFFAFAPAVLTGAIMTSRGSGSNPLWQDVSINISGAVVRMASGVSTGFVISMSDAALGSVPANFLGLSGQNNTTANGAGGNVKISGGNKNGTGKNGIVTVDNAFRFDIKSERVVLFGATNNASEAGDGYVLWGRGSAGDPVQFPGAGQVFQFVNGSGQMTFLQGTSGPFLYPISELGAPTNKNAFVSSTFNGTTGVQLQTVQITVGSVTRNLVILP